MKYIKEMMTFGALLMSAVISIDASQLKGTKTGRQQMLELVAQKRVKSKTPRLKEAQPSMLELVAQKRAKSKIAQLEMAQPSLGPLQEKFEKQLPQMQTAKESRLEPFKEQLSFAEEVRPRIGFTEEEEVAVSVPPIRRKLVDLPERSDPLRELSQNEEKFISLEVEKILEEFFKAEGIESAQMNENAREILES